MMTLAYTIIGCVTLWVDPDTGDIYDPAGDVVGNLNGEKPKWALTNQR